MARAVEIVLVRGLPGSGKSTLAKSMAGYLHLEADMYLEVNGEYRYDATKVKGAHDWCVESAKKALESGQSVVVSNTFVKLWEIQRYVNLGFPFRVIEMAGRWPNIHGVPEDRIEMMARNWEPLPRMPLRPKSGPQPGSSAAAARRKTFSTRLAA